MSLSSPIEFERLFDARTCATPRCDRRPARGSRYCPCCVQDRIEGRAVIFHPRCGTPGHPQDELLPFTVELERKRSAGPCPWMTKGYAGTREIKRNRARNAYARRKKNIPWTSNPPEGCNSGNAPRPAN